jgi:hypothetical protein
MEAEKKAQPGSKEKAHDIFKSHILLRLNETDNEYYRRKANEEKARVAEIKKETDPNRIIELSKMHDVTVSRRERFEADVIGWEEKKAAMKNPNTPTFFILYIYQHKAPSPRHRGMDERMDTPQYHAEDYPYVNKDVRDSAKNALIVRDWKLTEWEHAHLSKGEVIIYERQLEEAKARYALDELVKTDSKTEVGKLSSEFISAIMKERRG